MSLEAICQAIERGRVLQHAFGNRENAPGELMARLCANPAREFVTRAELADIAAVKLAAQPGEATACARVMENAEEAVEEGSRSAFAATDILGAVTPLYDLHGVGIPVASAVLSWCFPTRWPVIDAHGWRALEAWDLVGPRRRDTTFLPEEYVPYCAAVSEICARTQLTPQQVDRWLYAVSKCQLRPEHFQ